MCRGEVSKVALTNCSYASDLNALKCGSLFIKGPLIKDVRTEGGGGLEISKFCGRTVMIGCVKCGQGGGRGSKITKILRTSFMNGP